MGLWTGGGHPHDYRRDRNYEFIRKGCRILLSAATVAVGDVEEECMKARAFLREGETQRLTRLLIEAGAELPAPLTGFIFGRVGFPKVGRVER